MYLIMEMTICFLVADLRKLIDYDQRNGKDAPHCSTDSNPNASFSRERLSFSTRKKSSILYDNLSVQKKAEVTLILGQ